MYARSNLNKMVLVALIPSTFVISFISFSCKAEAQTFSDDNNIISFTLLPELFTKVKQSVVAVNVANETDPSNSTFGSGFIYDNDGHILTSMSAVAADIKGDIHVTFSDETIHYAKVIGADRFSDSCSTTGTRCIKRQTCSITNWKLFRVEGW